MKEQRKVSSNGVWVFVIITLFTLAFAYFIVMTVVSIVKDLTFETRRYPIVNLSEVDGISSDNFIIENTGYTYKIYISNENNGIEQKEYPVSETTIFKTKDTPYAVVKENGNGKIEKVELYIPENFIIRMVAKE